MKLSPKKGCPLHPRQKNCICRGDEPRQFRKQPSKWEQVRIGVRRIKDEHADHPDGYRYKLSPAEMRKVIDQKIREQKGMCGICREPLGDYNEVAPDHIKPKGMGGARADDRSENIQAAHSGCNGDKGSKRYD